MKYTSPNRTIVTAIREQTAVALAHMCTATGAARTANITRLNPFLRNFNLEATWKRKCIRQDVKIPSPNCWHHQIAKRNSRKDTREKSPCWISEHSSSNLNVRSEHYIANHSSIRAQPKSPCRSYARYLWRSSNEQSSRGLQKTLAKHHSMRVARTDRSHCLNSNTRGFRPWTDAPRTRRATTFLRQRTITWKNYRVSSPFYLSNRSWMQQVHCGKSHRARHNRIHGRMVTWSGDAVKLCWCEVMQRGDDVEINSSYPQLRVYLRNFLWSMLCSIRYTCIN